MGSRVSTGMLAAALAAALVPASAAAQEVPLSGPLVPPEVTATPVPEPTASSPPAPAAEPEREPRRARELPAGTTLMGALRRERLAGRIDRDAYHRYRRTTLFARSTLAGATGVGRAELASVLATAERLASDRRLTVSRLEQVLLTVRRNATLVAGPGLPAVGERIRFSGDPLVFQRYAGHGVQFHPLGTAGRANALARPCVRRAAWQDEVAERFALMRQRRGVRPDPVPRERGRHCHPIRLARILDRLEAVSARRDGGLAWEYLFPFGGSAVPWISGMAQGTASQAFARGAIALRESRYASLADASLHAFERPVPHGVSVPAAGGVRYALYSGRPSLDVLNGQLQAVIALHEVDRVLGSPRARELWRAAERAARLAVPAFDTGAWSLYSRSGRESTLDYHRLVRRFLTRLCRRTDRDVYCDTGRRFRDYERTPPRIGLLAPAARAKSRATLTVALDKGSDAVVRAGGRVIHRGRLERGTHRLHWVPGSRGEATLRVTATGPEGRTATRSESVAVKRSWRSIRARERRRALREKRAERAPRRPSRRASPPRASRGAQAREEAAGLPAP